MTPRPLSWETNVIWKTGEKYLERKAQIWLRTSAVNSLRPPLEERPMWMKLSILSCAKSGEVIAQTSRKILVGSQTLSRNSSAASACCCELHIFVDCKRQTFIYWKDIWRVLHRMVNASARGPEALATPLHLPLRRLSLPEMAIGARRKRCPPDAANLVSAGVGAGYCRGQG